MYKLSHGNVPKPIQNLNKSSNNVHTHFTLHAHHFHTMRGNNEFIYRTFAFQSVLIWNKLLQNINIHIPFEVEALHGSHVFCLSSNVIRNLNWKYTLLKFHILQIF